MDNDYIILFDENGSPYIAHAFGDRLKSVMSNASGAISNSRGNWKNHKYIEKIKENGKTLYFYTQEELQRYYNNKKNQAKETVNKVVEPVRTEAKTIKYNLNSNINAAKKAGNTVISKVKSTVQKANDIAESEVKATSKSRQEREYFKRIEAINSSLNKDMKTKNSSAFYDSHPDIKAGQIILQNKRARENENKNGRSKFNDYQQELTLQGTDYSPTEINKKVDAALIESGIQEYTGSDPAIKKSYNLIRQQREYYERSKVDLDEAKKVLEQSQREYERHKRELEAAKRTYERRAESGGSRKDQKN